MALNASLTRMSRNLTYCLGTKEKHVRTLKIDSFHYKIVTRGEKSESQMNIYVCNKKYIFSVHILLE